MLVAVVRVAANAVTHLPFGLAYLMYVMFVKMFNHGQYSWTLGVLIQSAQYVCLWVYEVCCGSTSLLGSLDSAISHFSGDPLLAPPTVTTNYNHNCKMFPIPYQLITWDRFEVVNLVPVVSDLSRLGESTFVSTTTPLAGIMCCG